MDLLAAINLWNPTHVAGLTILVTAFSLGLLHGITPDEHTWPITFSYAIGGYSTRRGLRAGLTFSAAFTLQRALASELAFLGLSRLFTFASVDSVVYLVVGSLMAIGGLAVMRRRRPIGLHLPGLHLPSPPATKTRQEDAEPVLTDPRPWMPAVHGFFAGWGFGAFALIIYTVLAPAEHSAAWAWLPGALFGLGTVVMQVLAGGLFGFVARRRRLSPDAIRRVALRTAGNTLTWGGVAFIVGGAVGLAFPAAASFSVSTGVRVHNLSHAGIPLLLVVICVVGVGATTLVRQTRIETRAARKEAGAEGHSAEAAYYG